ncbi:MAG: hypothetical protein J2P19_05590, partial [Pseudonocardia sp.]|nr:hypothetical protein [Pseudonocardia sp.]
MQPTELNASAASALATAPAVLELAESSRWRAPEVTAALAEQAVRLAGASGDQGYALRAEGWLAHGLVAIGRGVAAVPRAVRALSQASNGHDLEAAGRLRVALAAVARALGDRDTALALLAPVLEYADASLGLRADAHLEAARRGGAESPDGALESVGVAAGALRQLGGEYAELGLAAVDAVLARQERERGHVNGAMERAREGLRRVMGGGSGDGALDPVSPYLAAELSLELMLALLDGGQIEAVRELARSAQRWGARPGVLVPVARLRLTLAQRLYLPAGEEDAALSSAEWVSKAVESHDLPEIEVECHGLLAEVLERRGELPFALAASRKAHEAYRLHAARVEQALVLLARSGSEAKLAEARRHPGRARPEAGAGPSSQVAEAITQINFLDGGVRRTGRPGGCESSLPRRPNPLDSDTRPSRQVPPPPGSLQLDPHRSEGNQPRSAYPTPPASEAGTPSRFASPNPPDAGGRSTARPFEGEPSGRRLPAVPPLLGTSWRRTPGADPRQPTTTSIEARRQPGPERGRPTDDELARDGDGEFGRSPDGEGGWPSDRAPSEPTGPGFGARARSERGPRRPDERPGQPWTTSRGPGNPVSESTFGMRRVPAPGEAVRGGLDDPGGVEGPPVFPGRTEGGIPAVGGESGATFGEPGRAPRCRDVAGAEALVVGPEPGQPRPGADPETGPGMPGHAHGRPPPMGRDGGGDPRLGRPNEPARRGGPVRGPAAEWPGEGGRRRADETWSAAGYGEDQPAGPGPADGRWSGGSLGERARLVANEPGRVGADRGEGGWFGGVEPGADEGEGLWPGGGSDAGLG